MAEPDKGFEASSCTDVYDLAVATEDLARIVNEISLGGGTQTCVVGSVSGSVLSSAASFTVDTLDVVFGVEAAGSVTCNNTMGLAYSDDDRIIIWKRSDTGNYETNLYAAGSTINVFNGTADAIIQPESSGNVTVSGESGSPFNCYNATGRVIWSGAECLVNTTDLKINNSSSAVMLTAAATQAAPTSYAHFDSWAGVSHKYFNATGASGTVVDPLGILSNVNDNDVILFAAEGSTYNAIGKKTNCDDVQAAIDGYLQIAITQSPGSDACENTLATSFCEAVQVCASEVFPLDQFTVITQGCGIELTENPDNNYEVKIDPSQLAKGKGLTADGCGIVIDAGCGIDADGDQLKIDASALAGDGLVSSAPCYLDVNPGCGIKVEEDKVKFKRDDVIGTGLEPYGICGIAVKDEQDCSPYQLAGDGLRKSGYCSIEVGDDGCGILVSSSGIKVDPADFNGAYITANGCTLNVTNTDIDVITDITGVSLEITAGKLCASIGYKKSKLYVLAKSNPTADIKVGTECVTVEEC